MATLKSYSATFEQGSIAGKALARWRFDEDGGSTASDRIGSLDGSYQGGVQLDRPGIVGDGAVRFDGSSFVLIEPALGGAIRIDAFGDSLTAGTALGAGDRYSVNLEAAIEARGLDATVLNRGVNGETTADGLARIGSIINDHPDVVILELGTNDALQQVPLANVEANLRTIIGDLQGAGIHVLLTGTFGYYPGVDGGTGYATNAQRNAFEAIFKTVAHDLGVTLLDAGGDKFLGGERTGTTINGGVLDPSLGLNLDGLHPNAAGVDQIVARTVDPTIAAATAAGLIGNGLALANGSVELWFTPDAIAGEQILLSKNAPGLSLGDLEIMLDGDQVSVGMQNATSTFQVGGGSIAAGDAVQAVLTFGAGGMHLYVGGVQVAQNGYTGGLVGNVEQLGIGARVDGDAPFHGTIDEVALYDQALTPGEIRALFAAGQHGLTLIGGAADDVLIGGSDGETMHGNAGPDVLRGNAGNDTLWGDQGADVLRGAAGDDVLYGNRGHDELYGGYGDDLLDGGPGGDNLTGGPGRDTFLISRIVDGVDKIQDFRVGAGGDVLDLHRVLDFHAGDEVGDFVRLTQVDGNTKVVVSAEGDGAHLTNVATLIGQTGLDLHTLVNDGNIHVAASATG